MAMNPRLLRPRASSGYGLDARDWQSRVIANGGTVSASTMKAVDTFCKSIVTAGLRDRFYRLNLFAGTGLSAALVPLYRGPSLGGTQFGNTTDTNVNFVSGDYVETGASGGLIGNGSSKYLNTGFNPVTASASDSDFHLWAYTSGGEASGTTRGVMGNVTGSNETFLGWVGGGTQENGVIAGSGVARRLLGGGALSGSLAVVASSGKTLQAYYNGSASAGGTATATNSFADLPMFVFALNSSGSPTQYTLARRFRAYSFGLGLSGSQATAYHTALTTFQTALTRQV